VVESEARIDSAKSFLFMHDADRGVAFSGSPHGRYTASQGLDGDGDCKMKSVLIGAGLLAAAGVAFAASGYCPLCLLFWQ
jgi:hypothetical protein